MSHLSRDLGTIWLYGQRHNLSFTKPGRPMLTLSLRDDKKSIMRPLVQVQCSMPYDVSTEDSITVSFPSDKTKRPGEETLGQNITQAIKTTLFKHRGLPKVSFTDLSAEAGRPTLGALVGMSFLNPQSLFGSSFNDWRARGLIACTIASHWIPTTMAWYPTTDNIVIVDNPDPMGVINSTDLMEKARNIDIDLSYEMPPTPLSDLTQIFSNTSYITSPSTTVLTPFMMAIGIPGPGSSRRSYPFNFLTPSPGTSTTRLCMYTAKTATKRRPTLTSTTSITPPAFE